MIEDVLGIGYDSSKEKDYTTLVVTRGHYPNLEFIKIHNKTITIRDTIDDLLNEYDGELLTLEEIINDGESKFIGYRDKDGYLVLPTDWDE